MRLDSDNGTEFINAHLYRSRRGYDTPEAVAAMNAVFADLRLLQNLFLPTVKLVRKERVGAGPPRDDARVRPVPRP